FIGEKIGRVERRQRNAMRKALAAFGEADGGYSGILQFLSNSTANIVLVNLEDLWDETLPQNVPATSAERPNWRRLVRPSIEQIRKMAAVAEELSNVFAQRSRSLPV